MVLFAAEVVGGTLKAQEDEVLEIDFFRLDEIPHNLLWGRRQRILDAFNGSCGSMVRLQHVPFDPDWIARNCTNCWKTRVYPGTNSMPRILGGKIQKLILPFARALNRRNLSITFSDIQPTIVGKVALFTGGFVADENAI